MAGPTEQDLAPLQNQIDALVVAVDAAKVAVALSRNDLPLEFTLNVKAAVLRPNEKSDDKAPDFRIFAGQTEFGAAWKKTSQQNREYLSVKLDDPSFPAPIYASLVEVEGGHSLIWSR